MMSFEIKEKVIILCILFFLFGLVFSYFFLPHTNCRVDFELFDERINFFSQNPSSLPTGVSLGASVGELISYYNNYPVSKSFVHDFLLSVVSCN